MLTKTKRLANQFIRDKNNHVVVGQFPNVPLLGWFVCMIISHVISPGFLKTGLADLSIAFLFTWAYLEIAQGATYFRRLLGIIVMITVLVSYFR